MKADKAPIKVSSKYADFANIFLPKLTEKLLKYIKMNNHIIELIDDQQALYSPIYSLGFVKLKTLKTYIENNLANNFIRPSKSSARVFIFFNKKLDRSLRLGVDYQSFNNLIIKILYLLLFVKELLY